MLPPFDDVLAQHVVDAFQRAVAAGRPAAAVARELTGGTLARIVLDTPCDDRDQPYWAENLGFLLTAATIQLRYGVLDPTLGLLADQAVRVALHEETSTADVARRAAARAYADEVRRDEADRARSAAAGTPERLLPGPVDPTAYDRLVALIPEIASRWELGDDGRLDGLLAEWNALTRQSYTAAEISRHDAATSTDDYVRYALAGPPRWLDDLSFDEARRGVEAIRAGELPEADHHYLLSTLEHNLPGSDLSDLVHWPNVWFDAEAMLHAHLTAAQIVAYATGRSGRRLRDTPHVALPRPDPRAKRRPG